MAIKYSNVLNLFNLTAKATPTTSDVVPIGDAAVTGTPLKQALIGNLPFQPTGGGAPGPFNVVTTGTTTFAAGNRYGANSTSLLTFELPTSAAVGDTYELAGMNTGLFTITQNASQSIETQSKVTTVGTGGSLTSLENYNWIRLTCVVANTTWVVTGMTGDYTIV